LRFTKKTSIVIIWWGNISSRLYNWRRNN
jgi:hypothetical protein